MKLYIWFRFGPKLRGILDFGEKMYAVNAEGAPNRVECLRMCAKRTTYYLSILLLIFVVGSWIFVAYPLYSLVFLGHRTWILPFLIPGIGLDTTSGFYMNISYEMLCSIQAIFGTVGFDLFFTLSICHYSTCIALIENSINEMMQNDGITSMPVDEIRLRMRNVMRQLQDIDAYLTQISATYYNVFLVQPLSSALAISLTLLCIIADNWIGGYGYILFIFSQMISLCAIGQYLQNGVSACIASNASLRGILFDHFALQNQQLTLILYDMPWYRFRIDQQRDILRMLLRLSRSNEFWIGPFAPLNLETGSIVIFLHEIP